MAINLKTDFAGLKLKNPTVLASGILGLSTDLFKKCEEAGVGAVTTKSFGKKPREGHKNPTVLELDGGLINAVGLANPGMEVMQEELAEARKKLKVPVIASVFGESVGEFSEVAENAVEGKADAIELNVSCPNVEAHGQAFGVSTEAVGRIVMDVKEVAGNTPVIVKLTPQAHNIAEIALVCEQSGADAISAINTVQGMAIDIEMGKPMLAFKKGGLSGPLVRPVAVKCVYEIYEKVNIPILGIGGVNSGKDAVEMVMAGASAVGIGSGVYYNGVEVFGKVCKEMQEWMQRKGYKSLKELRGVAHD